MKPGIARFAAVSTAGRRQRGSVLLTAMLLAVGLGAGLVSCLALSRTALKLAHRTLFASDAGNLTEAGLEGALDCFNQMNGGVAAATGWTGWTPSGSTATRTLPPFNRDQNAIGTGKVFVSGYGSSSASPVVISQATSTPFDGGPSFVRLLRIGLATGGTFINGVVGLAGLSLKGQPQIDSFNSNPTNSLTELWRRYSAAISAGHALVVTLAGAVDLGNGLVKGNVNRGAGVIPLRLPGDGENHPQLHRAVQDAELPHARRRFTELHPRSLDPAQLPVAGHQPASDGRCYYFVSDTTTANTSIVAGTNVTIVGTKTALESIAIRDYATCEIYSDGTVAAEKKDSLNNSNCTGAFKVCSTTIENSKISGDGELRGSFFLPNANLPSPAAAPTECWWARLSRRRSRPRAR